MIPEALSALAAGIARRRRAWYGRPGQRRTLDRPVISVGNLAVGGRGKSPVTAWLAARLLADGEVPAVLSRGYKRSDRTEGVLVVRDAAGLRADVSRAGDEPLMLARRLAGAAVIVGEDRYLAGRLAECRLGCTVHVLDDGLQHLGLARDIELVLATEADLHDGRLLPAGRLREPVETARLADALLLAGGTAAAARREADRFGIDQAFAVTRRLGPPRRVEPCAAPLERSARVLAVAGIAEPGRFFDDLTSAGWNVAETMVFGDHHAFRARDVREIGERARLASADVVFTTEKDLMRLLPRRPLPFPCAWVPLEVAVEPADGADAWLRARLAAVRAGRGRRRGGRT